MTTSYSAPVPADEDFKDAFEGWTIVEMCETEHYHSTGGLNGDHDGNVEGGLTFLLEKNGERRKVILGYTELGEWLEYVGP